MEADELLRKAREGSSPFSVGSFIEYGYPVVQLSNGPNLV